MNLFNLSYSKIKTFNDCKIKYSLFYIYKIPNLNNSFFTVFGLLLHKFSELYLNGYSYKDIYKKYSNKDSFIEIFYNEIYKGNNEIDPVLKEIYIKKIEKVNKNFIPVYTAFKYFKIIIPTLDKLKKFKEVKTERVKEKIINDIKLYGILDIEAKKDENSIYILDIKSGNPKNYSKSQLLFYSTLSDIKDKKLFIGFINPKFDHKYLVNVTPQTIENFENKIIEIGVKIKEVDNLIRNNTNILNKDEVIDFLIQIENNKVDKKYLDNFRSLITYINENNLSVKDEKKNCKYCPFKNLCMIEK